MRKYFGVGIFILFVLCFALIAKINRESRKHDFEIIPARVFEVNALRGSAGSVFVKYRFKLSGKVYIQYLAMDCPKLKADQVRGIILNKLILVVYKKNSPDNSEIMTSESKFKYYNIKIPEDYRQQIKSLDSICVEN